jgi:catechol 2,3-dioxygenase-like lactoylglutathione lyase family enzyme
MIEGLSHMTFIVRDLDRMTKILEGVFDAREVYASDTEQFSLSREKFFVIGDIWVAIMEGEKLPERNYNHIAFKIDDADFDRYAEHVKTLGLDMRPPRPRVEGEGRSIYSTTTTTTCSNCTQARSRSGWHATPGDWRRCNEFSDRRPHGRHHRGNDRHSRHTRSSHHCRPPWTHLESPLWGREESCAEGKRERRRRTPPTEFRDASIRSSSSEFAPVSASWTPIQ